MDDYAIFRPRTAEREAALETALGDKDAFMKRLPPEIAPELMTAARDFSTKMGEAQSLLTGNPPLAKR